VRLFFALWPEANVVRQLTHAASQIPLTNPGRLVNPGNYHLTLSFIGEVDASNLFALRRIGAAQRASCCNIVFDSVEYWPKPGVIVGTAREIPKALEELSAQLYEALLQQRLVTLSPARPLRAHVTLARKVLQAPVLPMMSSFIWPVNSFDLVSSDTSGVQSAYTVLDTWPLLYER
jgi:RNA 2',3'-cyclic 3'-phosphodiesterase